jgi:ATP-dependent Clp protease adaptor protein ClpS
MAYNPKIWEDEEVDVLDAIEEIYNIVVYNDDVNGFDWVIETFIDILDHSSQQAEQLAIQIHHKGRAVVKSGSLAEVTLLTEALLDRGLSAKIE